jgi:hypothetical protein
MTPAQCIKVIAIDGVFYRALVRPTRYGVNLKWTGVTVPTCTHERFAQDESAFLETRPGLAAAFLAGKVVKL